MDRWGCYNNKKWLMAQWEQKHLVKKEFQKIFLYHTDINVNKFKREVPVDSVHMYA